MSTILIYNLSLTVQAYCMNFYKVLIASLFRGKPRNMKVNFFHLTTKRHEIRSLSPVSQIGLKEYTYILL
jgi:hypothetical protein